MWVRERACVFTVVHHHVPSLAFACVCPLGVGACGLLVALVRAFGAFIDVFAVFAVFALVPGLARAFL